MKPELTEQPDLMTVKLTLYIMNEESKEKNVLKDVLKDVLKELSERQKIILSLISENNTITIAQMAKNTNVTERTIRREIAILQERGVLYRKGGRKNGYWVIKDNSNS